MKTYRQAAMLAAFLLTAMVPATTVADDPKDDAPAPGSIADALRLRDRLPRTPVKVSEAVLKDGVIDLTRQFAVQLPVATTIEVTTPDGKVEKRIVTKIVTEVRQSTQRVEGKDAKAFRVTKDGTLEALDADKLADLLKKPTAVLVGESADVDARSLEMIKPGTVYLAVPPQQLIAPPVPLQEKPRPCP